MNVATRDTERSLVESAIARWREGEEPDAQALLSTYPELRRQHSLAIDLAYEEYALRKNSGEQLQASLFCRRFDFVHASLRRLLEIDEFFDSNPDLIERPTGVEWPEPGETFLGCRIVEELGKGGFARVFLAEEESTGSRPVALKVAANAAGEAAALGRLPHPHIMPVLWVKQDAATGLTGVCMPFLGFATLYDVINRAFGSPAEDPPGGSVVLEAAQARFDQLQSRGAPKTPSRWATQGTYAEAITDIGYHLADALSFTHSHDILHRDLKPSNVLLSFDGKPLLMDFNLSEDLSATVSRLGGTVPYMPPEQLQGVLLRGEAAEVGRDPRSDIYSLGVILFELITGRLPFQVDTRRPADEQAADLIKLQQAGAEVASRADLDVDPRLESLVGDCLSFDPAARPQSASEVAKELRRQLAPKRRLERKVVRHRRPLAAMVATMALCILGGALYFLSLPSYAERAMDAGMASYEAGEYEAAIEHFDAASEAGEDSAELHFARGQTYLGLGSYILAQAQFEQAAKLSEAPIISACLGLVASRLRDHSEAIYRYDQALEQGYRDAIIFNNKAYSHLQLGQTLRASEALDRALAIDASLGAAYHNRMKATLQCFRGDGAIPGPFEIQEVASAIDLCAPTAELYYDAACIAAAASNEDEAYRELCLEYLRSSIELGLSPTNKGLAHDPLLAQRFEHDPRFAQILELQPTGEPSAGQRLIEFPDDPDLGVFRASSGS